MKITLPVMALLVALATQAQSTFQNLDFESAQLPPIPPTTFQFSPTTLAMPGWTAYVGGVQQTQVLHNGAYGSTAGIAILGPGWTQQGQEPFAGILDGSYTVLLESGYINYPTAFGNASIAQTGQLPAWAQSLQFETGVYAISIYGGLAVSFDGNNLPLTVLSTGQSSSGLPYYEVGIDIAPYAGQVGQLEFTSGVTGVPNGTDYAYVLLDDIAFSTQAVPEPGIFELSAMGGLLFWGTKVLGAELTRPSVPARPT